MDHDSERWTTIIRLLPSTVLIHNAKIRWKNRAISLQRVQKDLSGVDRTALIMTLFAGWKPLTRTTYYFLGVDSTQPLTLTLALLALTPHPGPKRIKVAEKHGWLLRRFRIEREKSRKFHD